MGAGAKSSRAEQAFARADLSVSPSCEDEAVGGILVRGCVLSNFACVCLARGIEGVTVKSPDFRAYLGVV